MKRGYTLVEMLAVIAVLAIILVISIQITTTIVTKSKESTYSTNVKSYAKIINDGIISYMNNTSDYKPTVDKTWVLNNVEFSNDSVNCAAIFYKPDYGVVLNNCTVSGSSKMYYFYDFEVLKTGDDLTAFNTYLNNLINS